MMVMAAVAGPLHRMSCLRMVGDGEKLVFARSRALRVGFRTHGGLGVSVSLRSRAPQWARVAAVSEDATSTEAAVVEEQPAIPAYEGPTVKVTFELQRECHFGQQFKVVGDDAQFGDWDATAAVPLDWSEGHVWTAEVDVPEGKKVEFKYILAGQEGEVEWQPGANLVLEAAPGAGSLLVSEPWEASQPAAEPEAATDWEEKTTTAEEDTTTPADALADAAASAAVGALDVGLKAATALEGGLDAVTDSPNGVAESAKADEAPTAVEIPVVDAALAAAAAPPAPPAPAPPAPPAAAAPAEETAIGNGAIVSSQGNKEQSKIEEPQQPRAEPKKRLNPFQKDIEWLASFFGR